MSLIMLTFGTVLVVQRQTQLNSDASTIVRPRIKTVSISQGWSIFALPVVSTSPVSAKSLTESIKANGNGKYVSIYSMKSGLWKQSYLIADEDNIGEVGTDFPLQPGVGYLLYSDVATYVTFTGTLAPATTITFAQSTWYLISAAPISPFNDYVGRASDLYQSMTASGLTVNNISYIPSGSSTFTSYDPSDPKSNFIIRDDQGYMVFVANTGSWTNTIRPDISRRTFRNTINKSSIPPAMAH